MSIGLIKFAARLILTNQRSRKIAGELINKTYSKAKPIVKKNVQSLKKKFRENFNDD